MSTQIHKFLPFIAGGIIATIIFLITVAIVIIGFFTYLQTTERILPGIYVAGTKLSYKTTKEAAIELQRIWNQEKQIVVSDGFHQRVVSPSSIGIQVNALQSANDAYRVGHTGKIFKDFFTLIKRFVSPINLPLTITINKEQAINGLTELTDEMSLSPIDASIQVEGKNIIPIAAEIGYTINIEDTLMIIEHNREKILTSGMLTVKLKPLLPIITDVTEAIQRGEELIKSPVQIHLYDPITNEWFNWQVNPEMITSWVTVENGNSGPVLKLDPEMIAKDLEKYADSLGGTRFINGSANAPKVADAIENNNDTVIIINHKPTSYTIKPGDTLLKIGWKQGIPFWMIQKANPDMDPNALITGQTITIPSKDNMLPYPVIPSKRIVISIKKQRLWVYENGELLSKHIISTGMNKSPTQPGVFQVQTHERNAYASVWDLTMPHFLGIYEAWPGFMNGIHGLPTLSNGRRLWANVLGRPASYGCIIMKLDEAKWLYNWAEQGVVVEIRP
jgi:lipoprotein-anchoring transpeptidase ErfK/SrfK